MDGLIHSARNFLHLTSCVESNELELLSRPCHWSFGLQNHLVPCGRLVVRVKDALRQHSNRVGSRVGARTTIRTGAAAMILEGLWFAHCRFACLQLVGRFATHDVQSLTPANNKIKCCGDHVLHCGFVEVLCFSLNLSTLRRVGVSWPKPPTRVMSRLERSVSQHSQLVSETGSPLRI